MNLKIKSKYIKPIIVVFIKKQTMSKRKEKRRDKAELVCKEIRSQIVKYGGVSNNDKVCKLIIQWLKYGVKDSYKN